MSKSKVKESKLKVKDHRETIIRRYWNGQPLKEIAEDYNLHPTTLSNDKRRNADYWEKELRRLSDEKLSEVREHQKVLLRATLQTDAIYETTGSEKDKALHQQNLRELAYLSRVLADLLDAIEKK